MKTQLTDKHISDFWIRLYFDTTEGFELAAIKRAYRDFNRTLKKFPQNDLERKKIKKNWVDVLLRKINELVSTEFIDQEEFTIWHQATCCQLRKANDYELTQGQAQKWINMTLKYLFAFGETRVHGISLNYRFFHIPIDNVMMDKLEKLGIKKFDKPWSRISDYDSYYNYQIAVRNLFKGKIPMDIEFEMFNEHNGS